MKPIFEKMVVYIGARLVRAVETTASRLNVFKKYIMYDYVLIVCRSMETL